jgi:hypothetical protein
VASLLRLLDQARELDEEFLAAEVLSGHLFRGCRAFWNF